MLERHGASALLRWVAPAPASAYEVQRRLLPTEACSTEPWIPIASTFYDHDGVVDAMVVGLQPGAAYVFRVRVRTTPGWGPWSRQSKASRSAAASPTVPPDGMTRTASFPTQLSALAESIPAPDTQSQSVRGAPAVRIVDVSTVSTSSTTMESQSQAVQVVVLSESAPAAPHASFPRPAGLPPRPEPSASTAGAALLRLAGDAASDQDDAAAPAPAALLAGGASSAVVAVPATATSSAAALTAYDAGAHAAYGNAVAASNAAPAALDSASSMADDALPVAPRAGAAVVTVASASELSSLATATPIATSFGYQPPPRSASDDPFHGSVAPESGAAVAGPPRSATPSGAGITGTAQLSGIGVADGKSHRHGRHHHHHHHHHHAHRSGHHSHHRHHSRRHGSSAFNRKLSLHGSQWGEAASTDVDGTCGAVSCLLHARPLTQFRHGTVLRRPKEPAMPVVSRHAPGALRVEWREPVNMGTPVDRYHLQVRVLRPRSHAGGGHSHFGSLSHSRPHSHLASTEDSAADVRFGQGACALDSTELRQSLRPPSQSPSRPASRPTSPTPASVIMHERDDSSSTFAMVEGADEVEYEAGSWITVSEHIPGVTYVVDAPLLAAGAVHEFRVRAHNRAGWSGWSQTMSSLGSPPSHGTASLRPAAATLVTTPLPAASAVRTSATSTRDSARSVASVGRSESMAGLAAQVDELRAPVFVQHAKLQRGPAAHLHRTASMEGQSPPQLPTQHVGRRQRVHADRERPQERAAPHVPTVPVVAEVTPTMARLTWRTRPTDAAPVYCCELQCEALSGHVDLSDSSDGADSGHTGHSSGAEHGAVPNGGLAASMGGEAAASSRRTARDAAGLWRSVADVLAPHTAFEYVVSDLRPGTPYAFRVRAHNAAGCSAWSAASEPARTLPAASHGDQLGELQREAAALRARLAEEAEARHESCQRIAELEGELRRERAVHSGVRDDARAAQLLR